MQTQIESELADFMSPAAIEELDLTTLSRPQLNALAEVIKAERDDLFLSRGHAEATRCEKDFFDPGLTSATSAVLGAMYPPSNSSMEARATSQIVEDLRNDGLHVFDVRLPVEACSAIIDALGSIDFVSKASGAVLDGYRAENLHAGHGATHWARDHAELLAIPAVQRLVADPIVLAAVEEYLGAQPVHVQTNCWWTVPTSRLTALESLDAQRYHQDREYIRFVKLFVYLSDVDHENGPHRFVVGSHNDYEQAVTSEYRFSDRLSDEQIERSYSPDRLRRLTGAKGTMFLADTFAFHAGLPVRSGHRLVLQIEYANSAYFGLTQPVPRTGITEPVLADLVRQDDRLVLNYDDERYEEWHETIPATRIAGRAERTKRMVRARGGDVMRFLRQRANR